MKTDAVKAIQFWTKKLNESKHLCESVFDMEQKIKRALHGSARIITMSHIRNALVIDVIFDNDRYELRCTTYDSVIDKGLPDEERFEVLKIETFEVEDTGRGPYHYKKTKVNDIECNPEEDDLDFVFMRALRII